MTGQISNAAAERAAAKKAVANGDMKERDTYTAKQVASRCGTDAKTMRKFFRSKHSTVEPVGQGGRYDFDAKDLPKIRKEFDAWQKRAAANSTRPKPAPTEKMPRKEIEEFAQSAVDQDPDDDISMEQLADAIERAQEEEPSEEDLAEVEDLDLDLDDLDAEEVN